MKISKCLEFSEQRNSEKRAICARLEIRGAAENLAEREVSHNKSSTVSMKSDQKTMGN